MHFIIGADIITKKIKYILFILLIFSCTGINKKERPKEKKKSEISIRTQHWNTGTDSVNLYIHIALPLNHFVFTKNVDHFSSEITFTLVISDKEQNTEIYRESWKEAITRPYYEDTRDPDNYFKTEKNISLLSGTYNLFLNVQDEDSRKNWKIVKEIKLERIRYLSPSLLFIKEKNGQLNQMDFIIQNQDIEYTISYNESIIDSGEIEISYVDVGIQNPYHLPIPFTQHKRGRYEIELSFLEDKQITSFSYGYKTKHYWTDDVKEVVGVMRYILLYS